MYQNAWADYTINIPTVWSDDIPLVSTFHSFFLIIYKGKYHKTYRYSRKVKDYRRKKAQTQVIRENNKYHICGQVHP